MCGIAGIFHTNGEPASMPVLERMTRAIAHRGPDGEGFYCRGSVGLGHRRLAIIDTGPGGQQPKVTPDGRYTITYNGELYNFRELRKELESNGISFQTESDTEVLLHALSYWGLSALERFNGMFAFALWDEQEKTLILARDRFGVKPLYYALIGNIFLFASEVKGILQHPAYERALDKEGFLEYLTFQNFFSDKTLFKDVRLLPAGCFLRQKLEEKPEVIRYWDYSFAETSNTKSENEYVEQLDHLFRQAVSRQLIGDVPVGSYLSGGMDSGSITAIASQTINPLCTFTVGFDLHSASGLELAFDEREKAEYMAYLSKTQHYEMVLKAGDMERCMRKLVWHLEEPRIGQSYPNYYAAQLASKFGKVVLAGTGGDELFGGYPWRYYRAVVNNDPYEYVVKYYDYWQRLIQTRDLEATFSPIWQDIRHVSTLDIFAQVLKPHIKAGASKPEEYVNHSLYLEAKTFLHGLLVVEDKLSMAHGLENRVPFMDNDLVDFAMQLPVKFKLGNLDKIVYLNENEPGPKSKKYFEKTKDGKLILRKMMRRYIPETITSAAKQGFSAPDASWFKGESIDYVRDTLLNRNAAIYSLLDAKIVTGMIESHLSGRENKRLLIWSLLYLEQFISLFFQQPIAGQKS